MKLTSTAGRLNLEFHGVPEACDEDVFQIVVNLCEKLGVDIQKHNILTGHKMPKRFRHSSNSPAITARFMNRDVRNEIYKNIMTANNGLRKIPCRLNVQTLCQQKFDKRKKEAAVDDKAKN